MLESLCWIIAWTLSTAWPMLYIIWPFVTSLANTFVRTFARDLAVYVYYGSLQKPLDRVMHYIALFVLALLVLILVYQALKPIDESRNDAPELGDGKSP